MTSLLRRKRRTTARRTRLPQMLCSLGLAALAGVLPAARSNPIAPGLALLDRLPPSPRPIRRCPRPARCKPGPINNSSSNKPKTQGSKPRRFRRDT